MSFIYFSFFMNHHSTYPYSLAYDHNPILPMYRKYYFHELSLAWRRCLAFLWSPQDLLALQEENLNDFFMVPEISANLLSFLDDETNPATLTSAAWFVESEVRRFIAGGRFSMESLSGREIPGTTIVLGQSMHTQHISHWLSHPDHDKQSIDSLFWTIAVDEWVALYEKSFSLLRAADSWFFSEIQSLLTRIVPYWVSQDAHNSCSHEKIIGCIYASYPLWYDYPEVAVMEAIVHEYNHNKIHLIMRMDKLIRNTRQTQYYSPYRPDARHIHGIYLGLHAMVATYYIMLKCFSEKIIPRDSPFFKKTIVYVLKNGLAINTLRSYGKFTQLWEAIFEDMIGVHKYSLALLRDLQVDNSILEECKYYTKQHFSKAQSQNPILFY